MRIEPAVQPFQNFLPSLSFPQLEIDASFHSAREQMQDWRGLIAMTLGGLSFQALRAFTAGLSGSAILALSGEAAVYGSLNRGLRSQAVFSDFWDHWKKDSLQFSLLKATARFLPFNNSILQHCGQSLGMLLGSEFAAALSLLPSEEGSFSKRFIQGFVNSVALEAASRIAQSSTGGALGRIQKNLQIKAHIGKSLSSNFPSSPEVLQVHAQESAESASLEIFLSEQKQSLELAALPLELRHRALQIFQIRANRLRKALIRTNPADQPHKIEVIQLEDFGFLKSGKEITDPLLRNALPNGGLRMPWADLIRQEEIRERVRGDFERLEEALLPNRSSMERSACSVANQMVEGTLPLQPLSESRISTAYLVLRLVFEMLRLRLNGYHNPQRAGLGILSPLRWRSIESTESLRKVEEAHILAESDATRPRGLFVLSNHGSFLDFAKFLAEDPLARFGAGDFLFNIPIFKEILRRAGHFRITRQRGDRNDKTVSERAIAELNAGIDAVFSSGNHTYLLPEGFLSAEGGLGVLKKGVSHEAFRRGNYVLLRVVNGLGQIWKRFEHQRNPERPVSLGLPLYRPIVTDSRILDPRQFASAEQFHEALNCSMIELYMNTLDQLRELQMQGDVYAADQIRILAHSHQAGLRFLEQGREAEAQSWCDIPAFRQKVNYDFLRAFSLWLRSHYPNLLEERS